MNVLFFGGEKNGQWIFVPHETIRRGYYEVVCRDNSHVRLTRRSAVTVRDTLTRTQTYFFHRVTDGNRDWHLAMPSRDARLINVDMIKDSYPWKRGSK